MTGSTFYLDTFLQNANEAFHVARTTISSKTDLQLHGHDYAELFWIKSGTGIHCINGQEVDLVKGSLCMMRPDDMHTFKLGKNQESLVVTNVAFNQESLQYFKERYFPVSESYFWTREITPFYIQLGSDHLNELSTITDRLLGLPRNCIHLDYLMINIFRMISTIENDQLHIPHWLAFALESYNTPDKFKDGIRGFVKLTGRSTDHVNRVLKKYLEQSLTETVIKARLQYASQQLIMTNAGIKTISFNSGFESVSYFYRIFRKYTGQTPGEYRRKNHKVF